MTREKVNEYKEMLKEKAKFIEEHAYELYLMKGYRSADAKNTIEENLLSVLLSDNALHSCPAFLELQSELEDASCDKTEKNTNDNYALKVLFGLVNYVNTAFQNDSQTATTIKDKLRKYQRHLNPYMSNSKIVCYDLTESQAKLYRK